MNSMDIRPFIPTIDLETSKGFYEALGFATNHATNDLVIVNNDGCTFFLYRHDQGDLESNFMLQLAIRNIDDALESIEKIKGFDFKYEGVNEERWGKVIYLWGPSGEMWHVTELNE